MRFVTAYEIATDICINMGDSQMLQIARVLRNVTNAVNELYTHALPFITSEAFTVPANLVVTLPAHAGMVTKVGVLKADGKISMLYPETGIRRALKNAQDECAPDESDSTNFYNCNISGYFYPQYGYVEDPAAQGTYRFDMQSGTIELGGNGMVTVGSEIIVEYKSHTNERYMLIPEEAKTMVYQRAIFHYKSFSKPVEAEVHFKQFLREFSQLKALLGKRDPAVYIRALSLGHHSSVK